MLYHAAMQFKDNFKTALERCGINQSKLVERLKAAGCDVSTQAVSFWKVGKHVPKHEKMRILERVLRVPRGWLLDENPEPLPPLDLDDSEIFLEQFMALGKRIPPAQRKPAMRVLSGLVPEEPKPAKPRQRAS